MNCDHRSKDGYISDKKYIIGELSMFMCTKCKQSLYVPEPSDRMFDLIYIINAIYGEWD